MTYQEIVNRVQDIVNQHKMLADFGYGDISDLKTRFENTSGDTAVQADYPYLFLTPGTHSRNQGMITYNFNMIVMDMARGEVSDEPYNNTLAIQSQCQQYIDDVLAYLYFGYKDSPNVIYSGATYNPFNERFQDDVAGMTLSLSIQVNQPIDNCNTPIDLCIPQPEYTTLTTAISTTDNLVEVNSTYAQDTWWLLQDSVNLNTAITRWDRQRLDFSTGANNFEIYLTGTIVFEEPLEGESMPLPPIFETSGNQAGPDPVLRCDSNNWPTVWKDNTPIEYTARWTGLLSPNDNINVFTNPDIPGNQVNYTVKSGATLKVGYLAPPPVLVLDVNSTSNQTFSPDVSGSPQAYPSITTDTYNAMRPGPANFYYIQSPTTGNWVFTETGQARKLVGTEPFIEPRILTVRPNSGAEYGVQPTTSTFPTNSPIGTIFNYTVTWELELDPSLIDYVAIQDYNDVATEPQYETLSGLNLTATFQ